MIDIHCHILPYLDDGPADWDEAIRMAMIAVNNGIHTIIATPHHRKGRYVNGSARIRQHVEWMNEKLVQRNIPLIVHPGQEYHLNDAYVHDFECGDIQTLAGMSYLLVELPGEGFPPYFQKFFDDLKRMQLQIVIAHPERNAAIMRKPRLLHEWVGRGVLTQITSQSLLGFFGKKVQKTAFDLCQRNLTHFIASDAHDTIYRSFYYRESCNLLRVRAGTGIVDTFHRNASRLIGLEQTAKVGDYEWKLN